MDIFIPFIQAGLEHRQFCLCVASDPLILEEVGRAMREALPDFEHCLTTGQIEITLSSEWYLKDGHFDEDRVLQGWLDKLDRALAKGFSGVRFAVNFLLEKKDWVSFSRYEGKLEETLRDIQIEGLCAYNLNRQSAANVLDIMRHHQFTLARRDGNWEYLEGAQLRRVREEVLKINNELEQRVAERTAELEVANAQLRKEITDRKRAEETIRKSEQLLREAESLGHTGSWEKNLVTGEIFHTEENLRLFFGDDRSSSKVTFLADYLQAIHPDDREYVMQRRVQLLAEGGPRDIEFRVVLPDGSVHILFGRATVVYDERGQAIRVYGTNVDITERKRAEESIRKSERVLREAEFLGHTGSWEQDLVTGETFNSEANLRLFFGDDRSKGASFEDFVQAMHPDDREYMLQRRAQLIAEGRPSDTEFRVVWPDGSIHVIHRRVIVVRDDSGKAIRLYGTNVDITERKQAEEQIRRYAARMEALAEISRTFAEAGLDSQSVLDAVARRTAELIGDSCIIRLFATDNQQIMPVAFHHPNPKAHSLLGEALLKRVYERGIDKERFNKLLAGESIYIPVVDPEAYRAQLESEFWPYIDAIGVSSVLSVPLKAQGRVIGALSISRDRQGAPYTHDDLTLLQNIADRAGMSIQNAQLFRQVQRAGEQLEALSRRLLEVQEAERRALTTELHDRVGQNLTGLSINLQNLRASLSGEAGHTLAAKFDDAQALVEDTSRQIRDIMAELHLPELEDYGLAAALETYAERAAARGNLELIANLPDVDPPRLSSNVRATLFRAAQEAISNVLKHADATRLEVSLEGQNGRVRLKIEDNGQGFEPDIVSQKEGQTWGLQIMRERIESIGGKVQIESQPGQGTRVIFDLERPS
jgi:signal transduction histidine kinase/PAS domain-containing protein